MSYDVIVIGSGSTGGALAARLSEDSSRSVLVLEAGPTYTSVDQFPDAILDPMSMEPTVPGHPHNWAYPASMHPGGSTFPYPRGKGLGGSSSINGAYFMRALSDDFETWRKLGNDDWGYEDVLPYYRRLETDGQFTGPAHGSSGPIPVNREPRDRAPEFTDAFEAGCAALGHRSDPDKNDPLPGGGYGPVPMNISHGRRIGTALGYLLPAMSRPNLTITGGAAVTRVLFEGTRAVGVEALVDGRLEQFHAAEVVVATGALRTPQVLMLSGIGPAAHLAEHGIAPLVDLAGVGQDLTDHPMVGAMWTSDVELPRKAGRGVLTSVLHCQVDGAELEILPFVARGADLFGGGIPMDIAVPADQARTVNSSLIGLIVLQEESRGTVRLASADATDLPVLTWNMLTTDHDKHQLRTAVRTAYDLFQTEAMRGIGAEIPDLTPATLADDTALDGYVADRIAAGHATSTCRMGPADDEMSVVDQHLRVYGTQGLRIADTSIFPTIPRRGPNATAVMVGERLADLMSQD